MTVEEDSVLLPSGGTSTREVVHTADSISAGIIDADGRICLIRQYRYPAEKLMWEIPAGRIEPGETSEDAAVREAGEETGLQCSIISKIAGFYLAAGFATEYMHMFLMEVTGKSDAMPDDDEDIETAFFSESELMAMLDDGSIEDSKTLIFLNWYFRTRPR
jgi:ADP-ribose pyrophosphatase